MTLDHGAGIWLPCTTTAPACAIPPHCVRVLESHAFRACAYSKHLYLLDERQRLTACVRLFAWIDAPGMVHAVFQRNRRRGGGGRAGLRRGAAGLDQRHRRHRRAVRRRQTLRTLAVRIARQSVTLWLRAYPGAATRRNRCISRPSSNTDC